jgi:Raf kinase inhibitor-like YbhB/YbcL family protein
MPQRASTMPLTLLSPAFTDRGDIPVPYTCAGENAAPPLGWSGAPPHTASFALIVDDPDAPDPAAPKRTYVHWVLYDVPAAVREVEEGARGAVLPDPAREGRNDGGSVGYTGPCPPIGRHRYFFTLYALDALLGDLGTPTKAELERAMGGHVLERAELVGTYARGAGGAGGARGSRGGAGR